MKETDYSPQNLIFKSLNLFKLLSLNSTRSKFEAQTITVFKNIGLQKLEFATSKNFRSKKLYGLYVVFTFFVRVRQFEV